jgi:XTP/dITP diphosphohydrolase
VRLVLATGNPGKLAELRALLQPLAVEVLAQAEFMPPGSNNRAADETGASFVENALIKARHAAALSGLPAVADDSGLEVDALQGAPGIFSARYAGPAAADADNLEKLLRTLRDVPDAERTARFRCAVVFMRRPTDPAPIVCQGKWEGRILRSPRGTGGFGYDPIFQPVGRQVTAAELSAAEKNSISHRAQALQRLLAAFAEERLR